MIEEIIKILDNTKIKRPLVHAITNNITVNDCANIIHAAYGAPTMAQDEREVEQITSLCSSLVLNLGALKAQEAMLKAAQKASELNHPIVLDPVAAGASTLRSNTGKCLLKNAKISVIRGNASEIKALANGSTTTKGVEVNQIDSTTEENLSKAIKMVCEYSLHTNSVIMMTGAIDLISNGKTTAILRGGSEMMSRITGAGCMLTALTATYCGANPDKCFESAVTAGAVMKVSAELAEKRVKELTEGTASFRTRLIDFVSMISSDEIIKNIKLEILKK